MECYFSCYLHIYSEILFEKLCHLGYKVFTTVRISDPEKCVSLMNILEVKYKYNYIQTFEGNN